MRTPVQLLREYRRHWQRTRRYNSADPTQALSLLGERQWPAVETMTESQLLHEAQVAAYSVADLVDRAAAVCPSPKAAMFYSMMAATIRGELDDDLITLLKIRQGEFVELSPRAEFLYGFIVALQRGDYSDELTRFINGAKKNNPARRKRRRKRQR